MADQKRIKKPAWHNASKTKKAAIKRAYLSKETRNQDETLASRQAAIKALRDTANVHIGNKLLKPMAWFNPKQTNKAHPTLR